MKMHEEVYYGCQMKVPYFEKEGQERLRQSRCAIIGVGGLGSPVAQYLVSNGVGHVGLYDDDIIDESNINRQILYSYQERGEKKVFVAKEKLVALNPFIQIEAYDKRINESFWEQELSQYDIIVDCSSNFHSKFLIHDACMQLKKKLVQGGAFQSSGLVLSIDFSEGFIERNDGCYRCLREGIPSMSEQATYELAGVLSVLTGNVGLMQANKVIQLLLSDEHEKSKMMQFDGLRVEWSTTHITKNDSCACHTKEGQAQTIAYLYSKHPLEVSYLVEADKLYDYCIIDTRNEEDQLASEAFGNAQVIRMSKEDLYNPVKFSETLNSEKYYVAVCYRGIRSLDITRKLRAANIPFVSSLVGGYTKLSSQLKD